MVDQVGVSFGGQQLEDTGIRARAEGDDLFLPLILVRRVEECSDQSVDRRSADVGAYSC